MDAPIRFQAASHCIVTKFLLICYIDQETIHLCIFKGNQMLKRHILKLKEMYVTYEWYWAFIILLIVIICFFFTFIFCHTFCHFFVDIKNNSDINAFNMTLKIEIKRTFIIKCLAKISGVFILNNIKTKCKKNIHKINDNIRL